MAPSISDSELDEIHAFAVQLAKDAGQMLLEAAESRTGSKKGQSAHVEKESAVDLVTQTDEGECLTQFCLRLVSSALRFTNMICSKS
jgi:hypothetical protein